MKVPLLRKISKKALSHANLRGAIVVATLLLLSADFMPVFAEGSKDFVGNAGYRMFLDTRDPQQLKVYAQAGETINVGSSHVGIQGGYIIVYNPAGDTVMVYDGTAPGPISQQPGVILNSVQELAGPTGGGTTMGTGYRPGTITVPPGEEGVWTVIFDYPSYVNASFTNILNNAAWTRAANQPNTRRVVLAWDITITQGGAGNEGGSPVEGRVYSNEHISLLNGNGFNTSPIFFVLTQDGYLYQVNINEADPFRFPISSNSLGIVDGDLKPIYQSKAEAAFTRNDDPSTWMTNNLYLYEPQAEDNGVLLNNKIFFNMPAGDLPATAPVTDVYRDNTHETWLFDDIEILSVDSFYLGGYSETGLPCSFSTIEFEKGGFFYFNTNLGGSITLQLDLNNNGSYDDPEDVVLTDVLMEGLDSVFWDGNDGLGNPIPVQNGFQIGTQGSIRFGEIHIALTDVEGNNGGVTFEWLNDPTGNFPTDEFYFDHSDIFPLTNIPFPISGGGTPGNALPSNEAFTYPLFEGNDNYLDQWSFIEFDLGQNFFEVNIVIDCVCANGSPELTTTGGGEVCEGDDLILTAVNSTTDLGDLTYVWTGPNSFSFSETVGELETSTATIPAITSSTTGTFTVIASNSNGCADTMDINVNVNPLPDIDGIDGGGDYCAGDDLTLTTANTTAGVGTITNYTWTGPNGVMESGSVTGNDDIILFIPNITEAAGGTYSITMVTDFDCEGGPFTVDVVVNPTPVLTSDSTSLSVCQNGNVQFCATNSTPGIGTMTCTWSGPNGFFTQSNIGGDEDICLDLTNVDLSFSGTYTLVCTFNGCVSEALEFTLDVQTTPEINGISPSGDFCVGDDVIFTAQNVTVGTGDLTYIWVGPNGDTLFQGVGPELGPFPFTINDIQLDDAGTYTLTLITSAGCESVPQTTTIDVLPSPEICNVTGGGDACIGQDVTLSAFNCALDVLPVTWTWTGPGGIIATNSSSDDGPYEVVLTNVQVSDSGTYCFDLSSNGNGCADEQVCIEVNVLPGLNVIDVTPDSNYCTGETVVLTGTATIATGEIIYTWTGPNGFEHTDTVPPSDPLTCLIPNVTEGDAGQYILNAISDAGCTYGPDTVQVDVYPSAEIIETSGGGSLCDVDSLFLSGTGMGTAASVNYVWVSPNGDTVGIGTGVPVSGPFTGLDPVPVSGNYVLTITTPDGCTDTATENVSVGCTPIADILIADTTLCELDTLSLCGQNLNDDCGTVDYTWVTPSGETILGTANGTEVFCDEISPLTTYGSGTYFLFISSNGCTSLADSVEITLNPNPIISSIFGGGTYCEGDTAKVYFWNTNPAVGDSVFVTCNLPDGSQLVQTVGVLDTVCVFVTEPGIVSCSFESFEGCVSSLGDVEIFFDPGFDVTATSNSPVCSNETLELDGSNSIPCNGDANYQWIGPNGEIIFEGTAPCEGPFPASVTDPESGEYCLVVTADGTSCADTACIDIEVFPAPEVTVGIDGGGEFCVGDETMLTATIEKAGGGDIDYVWTQNGNQVASGTAASGDEVTLDLGVLDLDDDGEYCLELICPTNECTNDPPSCVTVTVNQTPDITDITGEGAPCEGDDWDLNATGTAGPGDVTYTWSGPNFTFTGTAPCGGPYPATIPGIGQDQAGEYTLTLMKGDCEFSQTITIDVNPTPIVTLTLPTVICEGQEAELTATIDPNGANNVDWELTGPNGFMESGNVTELTTLTFNVVVMDGDSYTLTAVSDEGCEADEATAEGAPIQITPPTLSANPNPLCPGEELVLSTDEQGGEEVAYCWFLDGNLLATTDDPVFTITDPQAGDYTVQAKVDGCDATSDPVSVTIFAAPDAVDDAYTGLAGEDIQGNVTDNDSPNVGVVVSVTSGPSNGSVVMNEDGSFTYTPNLNFVGEDEFTYIICLEDCEDLCDEAVVRITINPTECIVPNIITPNGDETNDILFINCVPVSPNNALKVFNRWGDEIFSADPYNNDWDGTSDGDPVPAGTYFYLFYPDKDNKDDQKAGYIKVVR